MRAQAAAQFVAFPEGMASHESGLTADAKQGGKEDRIFAMDEALWECGRGPMQAYD